MSTFVSVGNATQPFPRLLDAVAAIAARLPQPVIIQYGAAKGFIAPLCECVDYLGMEAFECYVVAAKVLILHAGAGSVINAIRAGKVPVVVPRLSLHHEHVDDHQLEFALELERAGKIVVCQHTQHLAAAVTTALALQSGAAAVRQELPLVSVMRHLLQQHEQDRTRPV